MPEYTLEEQLGALAHARTLVLLSQIHKNGVTIAQDTLEGLSESELYAIFDMLLDGTQVILAARRALRDKS